MLRPAFIALALLLAAPVSAQIYQWKDADGRTHYSDTPPSTGEVKILRGAVLQNHRSPTATSAAIDAGSPPDQAAPADTDSNTVAEQGAASNPEAEFRARREAAAAAEREAAAAAARAAERERFCTQARNQLRGLQSGQRIGRMNAAGEREFMTDDERGEEIERLEQQLAEHCN